MANIKQISQSLVGKFSGLIFFADLSNFPHRQNQRTHFFRFRISSQRRQFSLCKFLFSVLHWKRRRCNSPILSNNIPRRSLPIFKSLACSKHLGQVISFSVRWIRFADTWCAMPRFWPICPAVIASKPGAHGRIVHYFTHVMPPATASNSFEETKKISHAAFHF